MVHDNMTYRISPGTTVYGSDGEKIGDVAEANVDYMVVSKGFFFPKDHYIPTSAINSSTEDGIYLTVTKDEALNQGWDTEPVATGYVADVDATNQTYTDDVGDDAYLADQSTAAQGTLDTDYAATGDRVATGRVEGSETIEVPLTEEELSARKHEVERGAVRIEKDVVEEQQTLDVPVTEERVHVSRRTVDREVQPGDATFDETTIEVPVYGEEVDVEKRARVREELEVSKDVVQDTQRVTDTVRHEEARVVDETDTVRDDLDTPRR